MNASFAERALGACLAAQVLSASSLCNCLFASCSVQVFACVVRNAAGRSQGKFRTSCTSTTPIPAKGVMFAPPPQKIKFDSGSIFLVEDVPRELSGE